MVDITKEKNALAPAPVATAQADDNAQAQKAENIVPTKPHSKKTAKRIFDALDYIGLGWVANSTLSLFITYNAMPTKPVQKFIGSIERGLVPVVKQWDKLRQSIKPGASAYSAELRHLHVVESARSAAEILLMCVAGCIILLPMKWMEDRKDKIVDAIDRKLHPKHYQQLEQSGQAAEAKPEKDEEPKQTWGKLLTARAIGMASVVAIDNRLQSFNNHRFDKGKANLDTLEWKFGSKVYDRLSPSARDHFIDFFARKGKGVESINPMVRDRLVNTVGNDVKRMVFSEQARFFSKEISLTIVMAALVYLASKPHLFLKSLGKKKDDKQERELEIAVQPMLPIEPEQKEKPAEPKFTSRIAPKEKRPVPEKASTTEELHVHKVMENKGASPSMVGV